MKSSPGPVWQEEVDRLEWLTEAGYPAVIVRHPRLLHLCGYVGVLQDHPDYGRDYDELDLEVHGGLTWAGKTPGGDSAESELPAWWLGFDCAHVFDLVPGMLELVSQLGRSHEVYRDLDYVRQQCEVLAAQLKLRSQAY